MSTYSLKSILATFTKPNGTKRLIFNQAPIGGQSSKSLILMFIALPFVEYAAIFNPYVFNMLGIAQAIVFFIIFLVFIMQMVFVIIWMNNKKAKKKVLASWNTYFDDIDLNLVLAGGSSPYREFFDRYSALDKNLDDNALYASLQQVFSELKEENKELLEAMNKDSKD